MRFADGWLCQWQKILGIRQITMQGEIKSNDRESALSFPKEFKAIVDIEGY